MQKTDLLRFKSDTEKLWGIYRGVVEDRKDPLRLGRCRVRVMGVHTEELTGELNGVPVDELQWAEPIGPNFEGSISGSGAFCVPLNGSHVMLFYENGNMMQPRYFGSVPGFPVDPDKYSQKEPKDGFRDPKKIYPLDSHLDEQDWQRLSRVDKLGETYLKLKADHLDVGVPIAFDGTAWDEQPPMYEAKYPHNNVFATHKDYDTNIVVELDSTEEKERFAWWHPSLSYMEINNKGKMTFRNTFHRWDICDGQVHMHFMDYHFKTIDDTMVFLMEKDEFREVKGKRWTKIALTDWRYVEGDSYEDLQSSEIVSILEDRDTYIGGDDTKQIDGELFVTVAGNYQQYVESDKESVIDGDMIKYISGSYEKFVTSDYTSTIEGSTFRSIGVNDEKYVVGDIKHWTDESENHYAGVNYVVQAVGAVSTYGENQNIMASDGEAVVKAPSIEVVATLDYVLVGAPTIELIGPTINIGGVGSIVNLGTAGVAPVGADPIITDDPDYVDVNQPEAPPLPVEPIEADDPPAPYIPPKIPLIDVPTKMPEPGCP